MGSNMNKDDRELVFLSFDIEATGPSPATGSMVNFGMIGLQVKDDNIVFRYEVNLTELHRAKHTLKNSPFWRDPKQAEALRYITREPLEDPHDVFPALVPRLVELKKKYRVEPVAWRAAYDWQWINFYFDQFAGSNPLGYSCACVESYNWGVSREDTSPDLSMEVKIPAELVGVVPHSGLLNAYKQGVAFTRLWRKSRKM